MAAPVGNQFWRLAVERAGRPLAFKTPEELWERCLEYFEWVETNPLYEDKLFAFQCVVTHAECAKMRAMSIGGLCLFLGIAPITWRDYREKEVFSAVCARAEEFIRNQKFEGASADLLNPSIIARDLGLADKTELTGANGTPLVPVLNMTVTAAEKK